MVGRAGASKDAPVSVRLVRLTPSGSTTREISLSSGGIFITHWRLSLWQLPSFLNAIYLLLPLVPLPISPFWRSTAIALPQRSSSATTRY
ncbi:TPA: hypothetical protein J4P89_001795 [Escherichia coli]|nr:hypothetical protein [Escherichia albertii]EFD1935645.1 hypothetical protein [Escherichia coli]ELJ0536310.1 hypothetical protein [Escherichia coli O36]EFU2694509.1 hypothetical protein [Escherichia coli]EGF1748704.1 hypothetical protein [Escherichia coli]